jgi:hypothetical protein
MSVGTLFMVLAAIIFLLAGAGATFVPNPMIWGLFCMTLAFLTGGFGLGNWNRTP